MNLLEKFKVAIVKWADSQREWLKQNFGIEAIPSHDTIGRVLAKIDQKLLAQCNSTGT